MESRTATVNLFVEGASTSIDITTNLINFEYSENIRDAGASLKIALADPTLRYMSFWNIPNGSQIRATFQTNNWDDSAPDLPPFDCGLMWVDTTDLKCGRQGYVVNFSATSIAPSLLRNQLGHSGVEGVSQSGETSTTAIADGLKSMNDSTSSNAPQKRRDRDNESQLVYLKKKAHELGDEIFVWNGQVILINEGQKEQQPPTSFIDLATTPLISFTYKSNCLHTAIGATNQYHDPATGKLLSNTVMAPTPPVGSVIMLNTRERPPLTGQDNNAVNYPETPIDEGEPGTEGEQTSGVEYQSGPGYNQNDTGASPGEFLV